VSKKYKLAALVSHPIQYQSPLFRELSFHPEVDLTVYFCNDWGIREDYVDHSGFGVKVRWDVPLLEGYKYKFLSNLSRRPLSGFLGLINPSIIKEMRDNHYDAIWIHGYTSLTNLLAFLGAWISKTPIILRGESHLLNYRPLWKRVLKKIALTLIFKKVFAFLPIGTLNAEYYKHYGVPKEKMFLTPYSVDNCLFSKKYEELYGSRNNYKKRLGIAPEMPVILYASKMIPRKRAMDLLKAYQKIHAGIDAVLIFVGDGIERTVLEAYTKNHNLRNVFFTGFKNQTELPEYFVIADVFVLPSTDEPWGLVINEAMNFGLPIITTDKVGAFPDLVKSGEIGFIYPVGDIEELAKCLLKLLKDSELRKKMGKHSLEIISKWSFREDAEGILAALEYIRRNSVYG
jgi:glycosyltransferase involved in cell wall biosynthesis